MADLTEVCKQLLRIIFAEEICHVRVLQIARPSIRGHGQGLDTRAEHRLVHVMWVLVRDSYKLRSMSANIWKSLKSQGRFKYWCIL